MSPRLHLVRHGEGHHQRAPEKKNEQRHDPDLTKEGVSQCDSFSANFPADLHFDLLCASPVRRAIQTAQHCFSDHLSKTSTPILLLPLAQEAGDNPCDTGSSPSALRDEFHDTIDLSLVEDGWNSKTGIYAASPEALTERARQLRLWLRQRPENEIAICGHSVFWPFVTGDVDAQGNETDTWENAEWRCYKFAPEQDDNARVILDESWSWSGESEETSSPSDA